MTELLSVDEVAQQLQVQPRTVREYIRTGKLAARKIGKQYRIRVADLQLLTDGPAVVPYEPGADRATVILDAAPRDAATASRIVALVSASGFADGVDVHLSTDAATGTIKLILTGTLGQVLDRTATVHAILEATHD